jgi:CRP/FNR family transcriptional regulator, cyclic AMP receptor protein
MTAVTAIGYLASVLVFAAFWMRAPVRLRQVAIASNVAFFTYGILARAFPIAVLHGLLFPLNIWRLYQLMQLHAKIKAALSEEFSLEWIQQFASRRTFAAGETIFRRGDAGTEMYYLMNGSVRFPEIGVTIGKGALLGEMAGFSSDTTRLMTAECETDTEVLAVTSATVTKLFYEDPRFGFFLIRLITQRLRQDVERLRRIVEERATSVS